MAAELVGIGGALIGATPRYREWFGRAFC